MYEEIPAFPPETQRRRPIAWVTWTIIGSTVAVFLLQLRDVQLYGHDVIGETLGFSRQAMDDGRYWTLLTYAWAHAVSIFGSPNLFWLHIVANMIPLACLGPVLEMILGHRRFLCLYLGGAIFSALVWYIFNPDIDPREPIIGASGAVFAVIVAAGTAIPRARVMVYLFYIIPVPMNLLTLAIVACAIEVGMIVFGWMPEVGHSAHLGGAVFGLLYVLAVRLTSRKWKHLY